MGIFKKRNTSENEEATDVLLQAIISGKEITREKALQIPAVNSAVDFITNTFAMIPFKLYEESIDKNGKKITKEIFDERVSFINDDTKDTLDGFQFKKAICEDYLLGKGGYAFIHKKGNKVLSLHYCEDVFITIQKNSDPLYKNYSILVNAKTYNDFEFIKLLRNTKDGASGNGLVKEINQVLQTAYRRILYEYDLTVTGGSRKGFITSKNKLTEQAVKALKSAWENYYSGNANTVILNDGVEFKEASNTSKENEINAKELTLNEEIRTLFHLADNYENTIKNAITPIAVAFATALNRDLLLEREKKSLYFAPDLRELYKGTLKERYDAYAVAIRNGFKTRNEIRYLEDDDAIEGLDVINLGLGDVLFNAKTGKMYIPNTKETVNMNDETKSEE